MKYGYERVSTPKQSRDGNSLQEQHERLLEAGCERIFSDSYTGTKMDRPQFSKLMEVLKEGDTLVVTKLDRFARTTAEGIETIKMLRKRGVKVHILNMGLVEDTPMGNLIVTMLLAFAEFERDMIVERTSTGKAVAKANNPDWREGRKEVEIPDFEKFLEKQKDGELTVAECCKQLGISRSTWYKRERAMSAAS